MTRKIKKNKSEDNIREIINFYDKLWSEENEKDINIGWGYHQRRIHSTIFEFLDIQEDDFVLEIGCGQGDLTEKLSNEYKRVIAFDISSVGVKKARERVDMNCNCDFLICDAIKLPFSSHLFDVVIFSEVLEHVIDQKMCIQEIYRIIKPGGCLMLTTPNSSEIHRNIIKLVHKLLRKPYKSSSQIIDNPLSPSKLKRLLLPYFTIEKKRGILYTLPYLQILNSQRLINLSNRASEFIEERNLLSDFGLYQCLMCRSRKSVDFARKLEDMLYETR